MPSSKLKPRGLRPDIPDVSPSRTLPSEPTFLRDPPPPREIRPSVTDNPDFGHLSEDLGMSGPDAAGHSQGTIPQRITSAADDATGAGFIDQHGNPLSVDVAVQPHRRATNMRNATGQTGATRESAHIGATSLLRSLRGYSRSDAITTLIPRASHQSFDQHWLGWIRQRRHAGASDASLSDVLSAQRDALNQTNGLSQARVNVIEQLLEREVALLASEQVGGMATRVPLPNVR